jgi:hypothetical protein
VTVLEDPRPGAEAQTLPKAAGSPVPRDPVKMSLGAIAFALCVVVGVCVAVRPPLSTPDNPVKYWSFDSEVGDNDQLSGFQITYRARSDGSLTVRPEGMTQGTAATNDSATYIQKEFLGPVDRIGVTAAFPDGPAGSDGGAVALLLPSRSMPSDPARLDADIPDMGIHFVFDADAWVMALWHQDGGEEVLGAGQFKPSLSKEHSVDIVRRDDAVTVFLPNGLAQAFRNPNIATWSNNYAVWELYEKTAGATPAVISRFWAGWSAS